MSTHQTNPFHEWAKTQITQADTPPPASTTAAVQPAADAHAAAVADALTRPDAGAVHHLEPRAPWIASPRVVVVAPADCRFKGRNGYARMEDALVWQGPDELYVEIRSKRSPDGMAPAYLAGPPVAMITLLEELLAAARKAAGAEESTEPPQEQMYVRSRFTPEDLA